ncbi:phosphatidate cytidylyltransferase [Parabacteroides sp. OttesenSCG-928-K15]|nr:phosphatidate cytidylyltransferase [Parabacteroides sp. OttesenSCG-928-K15]
MKNLIKRALTGIVFVAIIVGCICFHPYTFLLLFAAITGLTLWEFYGLTGHYDAAPIKRLFYTLGGVYLFAATFAFAQGLAGKVVFLPYLAFLIFVLVFELYYKDTNPIKVWSLSFFAQIYCAGFLSLLNFLIVIPHDITGETTHIPLFVLAIFVFIWLNDTGAYLIGTLFGKHRLFERISPKKSWEGFWGGFIVAVLSSLAFAWYIPELKWYIWVGFAVVVVLFGTWGDLVESLLKRTLAVKDSGKVLPGHGGMLDRFDSLLLAIPASYIYIELFIRN